MFRPTPFNDAIEEFQAKAKPRKRPGVIFSRSFSDRLGEENGMSGKQVFALQCRYVPFPVEVAVIPDDGTLLVAAHMIKKGWEVYVFLKGD